MIAWVRSWLDRRSFVREHGLHWLARRRPVQTFETRLYVGRAGSGKTLFATRDAIKLMRQGVQVVANYRVWDRISGRRSTGIESWNDFLAWSVWALRNGKPVVFVIDEIHLWAPSRFYEKSPAWFLGLLAQHRHYGVGIIGTTQNLARCEIVLRELVYNIVFVRPHPLRFRWTFRWPKSLTGLDMPWFQFVACDPLAMGGEYSAPPARAAYRSSWVPWWVFAGYSTKELMAVNEWGDDEETRKEIAALTEEARELCRPERPETVAEFLIRQGRLSAEDAAFLRRAAVAPEGVGGLPPRSGAGAENETPSLPAE